MSRDDAVAALALAFAFIYLAVAFGVRTLVHHRRTGSSGFRGISGSAGSLEWLGGVLFAGASVLGVAAPALQLAGAVSPMGAFDSTLLAAVGVAVFLTGFALTVAAQAAMGVSWRIGVDADERTALVTDGPFRVVRNPIFAAMIPTSLGLFLMAPNFVALIALALLAVALELQTRFVEEPYLLWVHEHEYEAYAARVGRFVPGVGRLQASEPVQPTTET